MGREARIEREKTALRWALLMLLVLAPLPFGSVEPGTVLAVELAAALLGAWAFATLARQTDTLIMPAWPAFVLVGSILFIGLFQLTPLPGSWVHRLAQPTFETRAAVAAVLPSHGGGWVPLSLSPSDTLDALLRFAAFTLVGFAACVAVSRRSHLRTVALVLTAGGIFQAFYGSAEYLSGHQHVFAYAKQHYLSEATGTFINRNHFAGYLAMVLPFALGLALSPGRSGRSGRRLGDRLSRLSSPETAPVVLGWLGALIIWAGLLLSYSRGGLVAALLATAIVASGRKGWRQVSVLSAILILPALFLLWQDVALAPAERLLLQIDDSAGRLDVWRIALRAASPYLLFGTGLGTFASFFAVQRTAAVGLFWDHAHNDWLEALLEGGFTVPIAFSVLLFLTIAWWGHRGRGEQDADLSVCVIAGIWAIALHSVVDFCLRIPANSLLLASLAGMAFGIARSRRPTEGQGFSRSRLAAAGAASEA